jgi:Peptidase C13 family
MRMMTKLFAFSIFVTSLLSPMSFAQSDGDIDNANDGISIEKARDAAWYLAQNQKLSADFAALMPQRPGIVDAYVLVAGLDADPVFQKESAETAKVLARRFGAESRSIWLASGRGNDAAQASPANIAASLAAIAAKMDKSEDVLILYTTSHGNEKIGIVYKDETGSFGMISPRRLASLIKELGIKRKLVMISACYSGIFVEPLASDHSIIITAASDSRSSFGCTPGNDWTFFGDALINNALRSPQSLSLAAKQAKLLITKWEKKLDLKSSDPHTSFGDKTPEWLSALEARMPKEATLPIGRPAASSDNDGDQPAANSAR